MSDISENSNDKGFRINARGISCIPCRCKRQFVHQETKTTKENNIITRNTIIDKRNTNSVLVGIPHPMTFLEQILIYKQEALKYAIQDGVKVK